MKNKYKIEERRNTKKNMVNLVQIEAQWAKCFFWDNLDTSHVSF